MGGIANMVSSWSTSINVSTAGTRDKYNQATYTNTTILGRLVKSESTEKADTKNGVDVECKAKLYTNAVLDIYDKAEGYLITGIKECKDRQGTIEFYKYTLGESNTLAK